MCMRIYFMLSATQWRSLSVSCKPTNLFVTFPFLITARTGTDWTPYSSDNSVNSSMSTWKGKGMLTLTRLLRGHKIEIHCYNLNTEPFLTRICENWLRNKSDKKLTLANETFPLFSAIIDSIRGVNILHGLHHVAKKSTTTGVLLFNTLVSKSCSSLKT